MICGCSFLISSATADGIHPLQALDAGVVVALQDAIDQHAGLVVAQRLGQHGADVRVGIGADGGLLLRLLAELAQHRRDLLARSRSRASPWRGRASAPPSGPRYLNTSTASSSPIDISRIALRLMPSSLIPPDPVLHHVGDDRRILLRHVAYRAQVGFVACWPARPRRSGGPPWNPTPARAPPARRRTAAAARLRPSAHQVAQAPSAPCSSATSANPTKPIHFSSAHGERDQRRILPERRRAPRRLLGRAARGTAR